MKELIKKFFKCFFGEYTIYHIYSRSKACTKMSPANLTGLRFTALEKSDVKEAKEKLIRDQTWYHGPDTYAYGCIEGTRIVAVCYFWHGERYRERNYWPLVHGEAKLVQIVTVSEMRGRGIARDLISYAASDIFEKGFHRLYARIWHSNAPSSRAFQSAGWRRVATIAELYPLRGRKPLRMTLRTGDIGVLDTKRRRCDSG